MQTPDYSPHALRVADLPNKKATRFKLLPDASERANLATKLGFVGIKKLAFAGEITPSGKRDWQLTGTLGATIVQQSVVSLDNVTTRIDIDVERKFLRDAVQPNGDEIEMPEDDSIEELGDFIDPWFVMTEELALAAPDFPRGENEAMEESVFTEPGKKAMTDEDTRPFAALAGLKNLLETPEKDG